MEPKLKVIIHYLFQYQNSGTILHKKMRPGGHLVPSSSELWDDVQMTALFGDQLHVQKHLQNTHTHMHAHIDTYKHAYIHTYVHIFILCISWIQNLIKVIVGGDVCHKNTKCTIKCQQCFAYSIQLLYQIHYTQLII